MINPENSHEFMQKVDDFIDTLVDMGDSHQNFLTVGALVSIALARVHFLPEDTKVLALTAIRDQLFVAEQLNGLSNQRES